jgi:hypothetical protein
MRQRAEALVATAFAALLLLDVALGFTRPPGSGTGAGALVRFGLTMCAAVTLIVGPGFALAKLRRRAPGEWLGFSMLPGIGLLATTGLVAWLLGGRIRPELTCAVVAVAVAASVAAAAWTGTAIYDHWDRRAIVVAGLLFLLAAGRGLYSVDPIGDLYRGTVSQTNDASRPDSRIPFHVVQLIANGIVPWTAVGEQNFKPYDFSSRGPLAGLAAAPVVLLAGAAPDLSPDFQTWQPFDRQGFMAYRLGMEGLAAFSLLLLYGLARRLLGAPNAVFCLLFAVLTPFIVHETFFTWPKLLAGTLVIAGAHALIRGWAFPAGLLAGAAYLAHPLALFAVPTLLLLLLTRLTPAERRRWLTRGGDAAGLIVGVGLWLIAWRLVNGRSYTQGGFLTYLTGPGPLQHWLAFRIDSIVSTLVPLWSAATHAPDPFYDSLQGKPVPTSVLVAINYSCALPMAVGLLFSPLFLIAMWRAFRQKPWLFTAVAMIPLLSFWIYFGASSTGLIREGLQPWFLTLLLLYAWIRPTLRDRWSWWPRSERPLLLIRPIECLFVLIGPSILTNRVIIGRLTDVPALAAIVFGVGCLAWMTWQETRHSIPSQFGVIENRAAVTRADG